MYLSPGSIQGIVFPHGMEVFLLANSSKDNTSVKLERVEMDSYGFWVYDMINSTFTCLLRAPDNTWSARHCRPIALRHTQTWGVTRDAQGYHHLPPTPQPWSMRQTKVASSLDTMSMLLTTTLARMQELSIFIEALLLEAPSRGWMMNPQE